MCPALCVQEVQKRIESLYKSIGWVDCEGTASLISRCSRVVLTPGGFLLVHGPGYPPSNRFVAEILDPKTIHGRPHNEWKMLHSAREPRLLVRWFDNKRL